MSEKEVTQEALRYGYRLLNGNAESSDGYYGYWYGKGELDPPIFFGEVSTEQGLVGKAFFINEELEDGMGINDLLEKHKEKYLALVGNDFEEHMSEPVVENHRAIFFYNLSYRGQIQLTIQAGEVSVTYGLSKIFNQ